MIGIPLQEIQPPPVLAWAFQFDGTVESWELLMGWPKTIPHCRYTIEQNDLTTLKLIGPDGSWDIREGFWVVLTQHAKFEVHDKVTMTAKYEEAKI